MLPPVSGPTPTAKPTPADAAQNTQQSARGTLTQSGAERGPAQMRAETVRAVEPVRQSATAERLRTSGPDGNDLSETLPAGPPPAFVETLLERQARQAFQPPDVEPPEKPEATAAETPGEAPDTPVENVPPRTEEIARAGFAEAQLMTKSDAPPEVDRRE